MKKEKVSLNELMGSGGSNVKSRKLGLSDLPELLGESLPEIPHTPVGRLRLTMALRNRFGDGFRNIPGVKDIMHEFDEEAKFSVKLAEMKMIRGKSKG
jgi:hypothetical protein